MEPTTTRILGGQDVAAVLGIPACIEAVERAFALAAQGRIAVPGVVHVAARNGGFHVKSAAYTVAPHYVAVKVNSNFPANPAERGLPTIQGAILLFDAGDGRLLAVLDSIVVTALRTGAATAVAARHLAPRPARTATVIGCGVQGRVQLRSLLAVFALQRVFAADTDQAQAARFAADMRQETGCAVEAVADFAAATLQSELVVTCTPAQRAFLQPGHIAPGTFIAAVGADNGSKQEITPGLMARARVVVDSLDQCAAMGDLHHAIEAGAMQRRDVVAELGAVVAGQVKPGITPDDIVVFDSTGIAIQDVAAAGVVYERSRASGLGLAMALN